MNHFVKLLSGNDVQWAQQKVGLGVRLIQSSVLPCCTRCTEKMKMYIFVIFGENLLLFTV